jgi:hypothetical protein
MKRILTAVVLSVGISAAVFWAGPAIVERRINRMRQHVTWVPERVERLHRSLLIADLHADSLLWNHSLLEENDLGQVDVPQLIDGNVALQAFTVETKAPRGLNMLRNGDISDLALPLLLLERWPSQTWTSYKGRALYQARRKNHGRQHSSFSREEPTMRRPFNGRTGDFWDCLNNSRTQNYVVL